MKRATYKVVDQNFLREPNPKLHEYLSNGNFAVFHDFAQMEAFKGDALLNLRRSLEIVSKYPRQVVILRNTQTVIRITQRGGKRLRELLVDNDQTGNFGLFCSELYQIDPGRQSFQLSIIEKNAHEANSWFAERIASAGMVMEGIKKYVEAFPPNQMKEIRSAKEYSAELLSRILEHILTIAARLMLNTGFRIRNPRHAKSNYLFRYAAAGYFVVLKWLAEGGYEGLPLTRLQNDLLDMSYVAYATYYDGILSKDKKVNEIYLKTREFLDLLSPPASLAPLS